VKFLSAAIFISVLWGKTSLASTLVEDFSTLDHADLVSSVGVWNVQDHSARAQAYANGDTESTRPIDFGNGSDGAVNSSSGYTFNTDTHPNGYQFQSLSITAGTVTVVGSHPLVIRSLSTLTITPSLQVNGGSGADGALSGLVRSGGAAVTCVAKGGDGGSATVSSAASGGNAVYSSGATEASTQGIGQVGGVYASAIESQVATFTGPAGYDFDTDPTNDFICGSGGAGGGGYSTNGSDFSSGGAGGAGGGVMKLIAVGDIAVGVTEAKGGNGGNGIQLSNNACSGSGTGGYGGIVFFQTLGTLTTGVDPDVSGGHSGTSLCFPAGHGDMVLGYTRGDVNSSSAPPSWDTVIAYSTDKVPANLQSFVQSKAYDLGVLNASFSQDTVTSTGTVSMTYAGSQDGVSFSDFSNLDSVSNKGYRFLKFRANFTNPGAGGVAPKITGLTLEYSDLGLAQLDAKLFAGCGMMAMNGQRPNSDPKSDQTGVLFTLFGILMCYGITRLRLG
jgi:hypothetical protein